MATRATLIKAAFSVIVLTSLLNGVGASRTRAAQSAGIVVVPPLVAPTTQPQLGVNLEGVNDYSRSMMFVDAMKSARHFGSEQTPWDVKAPVDSHGWPTGDAGVVVIADVPVQVGEYHFSCTGYCVVEAVGGTAASVRSLAYDRSSNTTKATVVVGSPINQLFLGFKNTKGGIQNAKLIRPGYPLDTKELFTREFLAALTPFSTMRLMDYLRTNSTDVKEWSERPTMEDATQTTSRGGAWEYSIALANQTHKDLWINVPDLASDDYVKQLATLLKNTLDKDRVVYVEYSNEVWNSIFPQNHRTNDAAKKEIADGNTLLSDGGKDKNQYYWGWKRVSERLVQISQIFKQVFGDEALNTRIRPVLASQSANGFLVKLQIEFIRQAYGPPSQFIYGLAGAPYLGPDNQFNKRTDITLDDIFNKGLFDGMNWVRGVTTNYSRLAHYYGIHSLCYEGGVALEGDAGIATKIKANYDPRSGTAVTDYLNTWYGTGGELFMYYNLCCGYSKHGCWGLTDDIRKKLPKYAAAAATSKGPLPPVNIGRAPGQIQAWQYDANEGGGVEESGDGGKNLAYLHPGHTFDYLLNIKKAGIYSVTVQSGAPSADASVEVFVNDHSLGIIKCTATGDFHKWASTLPMRVQLPEGLVVVRMKIVTAGMNIRSLTVEPRN